MAFTVSLLTDEGLTLVSSASATNTLVLDHVYLFGSPYSESDCKIYDVSDWLGEVQLAGASGSVVSAGSDPNYDNTSRIVVSLKLNNGTTSAKVARTIVITGHSVNSGTAGDEKTLYVMSDATGISIPYNAKTSIQMQVAITFGFNRASSITTADNVPNYLLVDETSRFVTTHKAGQPGIGDNQDLYGYKTFCNDIKLDSYGGSNCPNIRFMNDTDEVASVSYEMSTGNVRFDLNQTDFDSSEFIFYDRGDSLCEINWDSGHDCGQAYTGTLRSNRICSDYIISQGEDIADEIYVCNSLVANSSSINIGSSSDKFNNIYAEALHANIVNTNTLKSASSSEIKFDSQCLLPDHTRYATCDLGTAGTRWSTCYVNTVAANTIACGSMSVSTLNIYNSISISGTLDVSSGNTILNQIAYNSDTTEINVPIGSFVLAAIPIGSNYTEPKHCGENLEIVANQPVYVAKNATNTEGIHGKSTSTLPAGTYRCLSEYATMDPGMIGPACAIVFLYRVA